MAKTADDLFKFLHEMGIETETREHPPLFTVDESQTLRGSIPGAHTKNLFLKDKKGRYFLVTVEERAVVDLKTIHQVIGASGRVSFGKEDALMELLGVTPGAVTLFGLINDEDRKVTLVLDEPLMEDEVINGHPLHNRATTSIGRDDLLRFLRATGHDPLVLKVSI
ncbi:prolyl-tRNA synthetase associated domain-containing protein [Nitratireductor thuwali]|uniref:Prolyl-tRNA editing protein ProX n=1 Tax=Nitratireductor thuwali TaxID=2267699 RepID=A0ABY5ML45_9HYPH|nr:Prolyl-tRNA editing protein ProX [Nitratireductor thuwali]